MHDNSGNCQDSHTGVYHSSDGGRHWSFEVMPGLLFPSSGDPAVTYDPVRHVFLFAFAQSGGTIQFVSDVEGGPILDPVPGPFIDETGTVQDAAIVTWTLANGSTVVDTIAFVSDIPEPASAALLCIGLICLGLICGTRARFRLVLRPSSGLRSA